MPSATPPVPERLRPRKEPAQARSRQLVDAVVEAAARLLAERGWDGLTMQDVAALAGVSPGSLYQYFPDKAALVTELVERQSERELAFHLQRFAAIPPEAGLAERLEGMIAAVLDFQAQEGALMRQSLQALQHLGRYAALAERSARAAAVLEAVLAAHPAALGGREPRLVAHVLANAIHSLTHDGVLPRPPWLDDELLAREVLALVFGYLGLDRPR